MKESMLDREHKREMIVGAFAFLVIIGLFCFSIFVTGSVFWKDTERLVLEFEDIMGLNKGDRVVVRGMRVGEVKKLIFKDTGVVRVICAMDEPIAMKTDYVAQIIPTSILGGRYVEINEGSADAAPLPADAVVRGIRPNDLMNDAAAIIGDIKTALEDDGMLEDFQETIAAAREVADKLKAGDGTLGKLINDEQLYADLTETAANLKTVSENLANGKGFLGKMMDEEDPMYGDTKLLLEDVRAAVDDFRESSPILTFSSIFFGAL